VAQPANMIHKMTSFTELHAGSNEDMQRPCKTTMQDQMKTCAFKNQRAGLHQVK
jgi:hypothetical protein